MNRIFFIFIKNARGPSYWYIQNRFLYSSRNYYEVLNLSRSCTNQEIRDSFTKLSKQFHPDTCKTGDVKQNAKKFQEILEAYKVLSKRDSRSFHDTDEVNRKSYSSYSEDNSNDHYNYDYERMRRKMNREWANRNQRSYEHPNFVNSKRRKIFSNVQLMSFFLLCLVFNSIFVIMTVRYRLKSRDFDNPDQMRYGHSYRYTRQEFRNKADIPGSDINN